MDSISKIYRIKDNSIGIPKTYLGAEIVQYRFPDDSKKIRWGMSSHNYINNAIKTVEAELHKCNKCLFTNVKTPISCGYRPKMDVRPLLDPSKANYYQNVIGILHWAIELGRVDILVMSLCYPVSFRAQDKDI